MADLGGGGLRRSGTLPLIVAMIAAAGIGVALLASFPGESGATFLDLPEARIWVFTNCVLLAMSVAVGLWTFPTCRGWFRETGSPMIGSATAALYVALLVVSIMLSTPEDVQHPITHHAARVALLVLVVMLGGFPSFATLILMSARLSGTSHAGRRPDQQELVDLTLRARADMSGALTALASLMTLSVLATGAHWVALEEWRPGSSPSPYTIVAYGAYFSALIAVAYLPTWIVWRAAATTVRDHLHPLPSTRLVDRTWLDDRAAVDRFLGLGVGSRSGLRSSLEVAAPLAAAVLPLLGPGVTS